MPIDSQAQFSTNAKHSLSTWKEKTEILKLRAEEEIRSDP